MMVYTEIFFFFHRRHILNTQINSLINSFFFLPKGKKKQDQTVNMKHLENVHSREWLESNFLKKQFTSPVSQRATAPPSRRSTPLCAFIFFCDRNSPNCSVLASPLAAAALLFKNKNKIKK